MTDIHDVLAEIADERTRQIDAHNWTPELDDRRPPSHWGWLISRRGLELSHPWPDDAGVDVRRLLVEIAAISVAAIESFDRKTIDP